MKPRNSTTRVANGRHVASAMIGLTAVAALLTGTSSGAMAAPTSSTCTPSKPTIAYKPAVTSAKAALTATLQNLQNKNYDAAARHLRLVKQQTRIAHTAATALIGVPPPPESDDPPGIAAVQSVAGLEHQIASKLVPSFHNVTKPSAVRSLGTALRLSVSCRDVMLTKVIALKPGARGDYADGLADTLPSYKQEQTALTAALAGAGLTAAARTFLQDAQSVVNATASEMNRVFGGGERSPGLPR